MFTYILKYHEHVAYSKFALCGITVNATVPVLVLYDKWKPLNVIVLEQIRTDNINWIYQGSYWVYFTMVKYFNQNESVLYHFPFYQSIALKRLSGFKKSKPLSFSFLFRWQSVDFKGQEKLEAQSNHDSHVCREIWFEKKQ
jgi:hypothetical protein